jgi:CubicO group peptidase (beta-lactamase class C family)
VVDDLGAELFHDPNVGRAARAPGSPRPGGQHVPTLSRFFSNVSGPSTDRRPLFRPLSAAPASRLPGTLGTYSWGGAAATALWIDPKEELAIVFMTQVIGSEARLTLRRDLRTLVYSAMTESLRSGTAS